MKGRPWRGGCLEEAFFLRILPPGFVPVDYDPDAPDIQARPERSALWLNSNHTSLDKAHELVRQLSPYVVLHCGDQHGNREDWDELRIGNHIYLRQHRHPHYRCVSSDLIHYLPLGYHREMHFAGRLGWREASVRPHRWSWYGQINNDRRSMLHVFDKLGTGVWGDNQRPQIVASKYLDSRFVPCGRGQHSLNCFRIYEAAHCGAIPVVVGSRLEIHDTFCEESLGDPTGLPPWLFAESWSKAAERVRELNSSKLLDRAQERVLLWWSARVHGLINLLDRKD